MGMELEHYILNYQYLHFRGKCTAVTQDGIPIPHPHFMRDSANEH